MHDYKDYRFKGKELVLEFSAALFRVVFTGILFFRSWIGCIFLLPVGAWHLSRQKKKKKEKRRMELKSDFKEVILSIASSLHAGYSLEQAVAVSLEEIKRLYPDGGRAMEDELIWMLRNLELNVPVEALFGDLARRSGAEEIENYAVILQTVRHQGGNLVSISREAAEHISKKVQVQMEIEQIVAGKNLEKNIMVMMPYFILVYLQIANGEYMDTLFYNLPGILCMVFCLAAIYMADWWSAKIMEIEI